MNEIRTITPEDLKARLAKGEIPQIIDVREEEEVAQGMIPGAKHIPLGQLPERLKELKPSDELIFVCRSGGRSGRACEYLQAQGFSGLVNMVGGMLAWEKL